MSGTQLAADSSTATKRLSNLAQLTPLYTVLYDKETTELVHRAIIINALQ